LFNRTASLDGSDAAVVDPWVAVAVLDTEASRAHPHITTDSDITTGSGHFECGCFIRIVYILKKATREDTKARGAVGVLVDSMNAA
jgi:hypothetical protein